jgi:uncharacterized protein YcfL
MKKVVLVVLASIGIVGCSSTPSYKLKGYTGPEAMERNEVVQASKQCIYAKLRPNVEFVTAKTNSGKVMVPVNVHCQPY